MSVQMDVDDVAPHFRDVIARVRHGEEITLAEAGEPVARLVPICPAKKPREFGLFKGKVRIADDFCAPLPDDVLKEFEK